MKKNIVLTALVVLLAVSALTCPSAEDHEKKYNEYLTSQVSEQLSGTDNKLINAVGGAVGEMLGGAVSRLLVGATMEYHSYFFFSTGVINDKTVTLGLFNKVFAVSDPL